MRTGHAQAEVFRPLPWAARRLLPLLLLLLILPVLPARAIYIPKFHLKQPPKGTVMDVLSRRIVYDSRRDVATATGDVRITYGPYVLLAPKVVYDRRHDILTATGNIEIHEPDGNILFARYGRFDSGFRDGFARHLRMLMTNSATLKARYLVRRKGYLTTYYDVHYTRCSVCKLDGGRPLWELVSKRALHDAHKGRIYHRDMKLLFAGVPIFWTPYFSHPDPEHPRSSGFLTPGFSYSRRLGFGLALPYFINLAPNYDITLRPAAYTSQGLLARATWRHRVANGAYSIDFGGIRQMKPKKLSGPGRRKWRGFVRGTGEFTLNSRWKWGFDGAFQSDRTMMRRYKVDSRDKIETKVWLTGLDGRNYFHARASRFRKLEPDSNNRVEPIMAPYVHYTHTFADSIAQGELIFDSHIYSLYRQDPQTFLAQIPQGTRQTRAVTQLLWRRRMVSPAGIVAQPFARLRSDIYSTSNLPDPSVPGGQRDSEITTRFLPSAGLDVRWPFLRNDGWGRHVFSPVAQIIAARDEVKRERIGNEDAISLNFTAHNLFLHDRFSGYDRYEGGVRANVGLLYSLYMPSGGFLRASIGQSYHLAGKNSFSLLSGLGRDYSDVVAAVAYAPNDDLRISWQGRFDGKNLSLSDQAINTRFHYQDLTAALQYARIYPNPGQGVKTLEQQVSASAEYLGFSASVEYRRAKASATVPRREEIDAKAGWKFNENWRVFGGWGYDLAKGKDKTRTIGLAYDCDCFSFSLKYVRDYTSDPDGLVRNAFYLDVEFKTLGGGSTGGRLF